jgi:hypothetical protein
VSLNRIVGVITLTSAGREWSPGREHDFPQRAAEHERAELNATRGGQTLGLYWETRLRERKSRVRGLGQCVRT